MPVEITALLVFCASFAALILFQALSVAKTNGLQYLMGNRDTPPAEHSALSGRLSRTISNTLETAILFVPLVLCAGQLGVSNPLTQWGAIVFVAARIAYSIVYPAGITGLRSLIWNVGFASLFVLGLGLVWG